MASWVDGKSVLVTAAGQGIGRAAALAFAAAGARVVATDINEETLATLSGASRIETRRMDVLSDSDVIATVEAAGPFDALFNCAGYVHGGSILEMKDEEFDFAVDLNIRSMVRTIRAVLPAMLERGGGAIINMSSVASSIKGVPNRFIYGTTKAAVIGLTKAVAADFVTQGIRCNAICPGTVQSPSLDQRIKAQAESASLAEDDVRKAFVERQPMGRLGEAEEIAAAAVYLASDESRFVTGQTMIVDGGFTL